MLMQATKAFVFKERRLASLIWLWSLFGTLMLFLLVDYLTTITLLSKIPYFSEALLWLIPIYYLFTLYLCYLFYGSGLGASILAFVQFILQIAVLIFFWGFYSIFYTTDYQVNTTDLNQKAPSKFTESSKLAYPNDAELIHTSLSRWGPNVATDIVIKVDDIDSFVDTAVTKYKFYEMTMDFPGHDREYLGYGFDPFQGILSPPFCLETTTMVVKPRYFKVTKKLTDPENFCGKREVYYSELKTETELSILMVIFPKEGLVWLNRSDWF